MIEFTQAGDITIASIVDTNRINTVNAASIKKELSEKIGTPKSHLTIDLANIKFIDSTGIGVLLSALKNSRENQGSFAIKNVNPEVMKLLVLMKLDKIIDIEQ